MRPFYQLTDRGRALRLRRMAITALERYDLDIERVRLVPNDLHGVFRVDTNDGPKYVLRLSVPGAGGPPLDVIRSEMIWLTALSRDTDLWVPHAHVTLDDALVTTVEVEGVPEPRHCAVFSWVPGPNLADCLSPENVARQGEFSARLHEHAATFTPPEGLAVRRKDKVFPYKEPAVLFDGANQDLMAPSRRSVFERAIDRVQEALERLYSSEREPVVIHNDLHQWNVKIYRGRVSALDFEDLMWGHAVQDIAASLYYYQGYENYAKRSQAFKRGYERFGKWPEQYRGQIDTFIAGRGLTLANLDLQDPDPGWRRMAPEFIERVEGRLRNYVDNALGKSGTL